jgi:hypothetical protein
MIFGFYKQGKRREKDYARQWSSKNRSQCQSPFFLPQNLDSSLGKKPVFVIDRLPGGVPTKNGKHDEGKSFNWH